MVIDARGIVFSQDADLDAVGRRAMQAGMRKAARNYGIAPDITIYQGFRRGGPNAAALQIPEGIGDFPNQYLGDFPTVPLSPNRDQICVRNWFRRFWGRCHDTPSFCCNVIILYYSRSQFQSLPAATQSLHNIAIAISAPIATIVDAVKNPY